MPAIVSSGADAPEALLRTLERVWLRLRALPACDERLLEPRCGMRDGVAMPVVACFQTVLTKSFAVCRDRIRDGRWLKRSSERGRTGATKDADAGGGAQANSSVSGVWKYSGRTCTVSAFIDGHPLTPLVGGKPHNQRDEAECNSMTQYRLRGCVARMV